MFATRLSAISLHFFFLSVHDPFQDFYKKRTVPKEFMKAEMNEKIEDTVEVRQRCEHLTSTHGVLVLSQGTKRKMYAKTLAVLDIGVSSILDTLESTGMMDNTYVIFA